MMKLIISESKGVIQFAESIVAKFVVFFFFGKNVFSNSTFAPLPAFFYFIS